MRLLSVIHGPAYGGAHNQLARLARPLQARGIETVALLPEQATTAAERLRSMGIDVVQMPLGRLRASPDPRLQARFLASLRGDIGRIQRLIGERQADVVQVHGITNPQAAIAARRTGGVGVVTQILDTRAPMALRRALMPLTIRLSDELTIWGHELARVHPGAERLGERLRIVYPPIDADALGQGVGGSGRAESGAGEARNRLGIADGETLIGTVGVLNPQKGHQYLVEAAAILSRDHPRLKTRILGAESCGHSAYAESLQRRSDELGLAAEGRLEFVDPGDDVATLLKGFDVFVMTSVPRSEGMPTAILEAMASGLPVVSTRVGAVAELVEDGATGLLVEPEDPAAIAAAVARLLDDPELRRRLGAVGCERALQSFKLEDLADLHADAYRGAVERAASRRSD